MPYSDTYAHYHSRSLSGSRSPFYSYDLEDDTTYYSPSRQALVRRSTSSKSKPSKKYYLTLDSDDYDTYKSKRTLVKLSDNDDDGVDDYPWPGTRKPLERSTSLKAPKHTRSSSASQAITIVRKPTHTLEKYNIWSSDNASPSKESALSDPDLFTRKWKKERKDKDSSGWDFEAHLHFSKPSTVLRSPKDKKRDRDDEIVAVVDEKEGRTTWLKGSGAAYRKEKFEQVDWEGRERERGGRTEIRRRRSLSRRRDSGWGADTWDEAVVEESPAVEREGRYRRISRSRDEEWRPLSGFRHF